jgi:transmembrane sensor
MAAAVAGAIGIWTISQPGTSSRQIATGPGEHRTIALADGSRIVMNGGTRIVLEQDNPRGVELVSGEALFEVRHDDAQPFIVSTGVFRLVDMGNVFNVAVDDGALDVAVAEGAVKYQSPSREIHLNAGDGLSRASAAAAPVVRKASPSTVGGWRTGHLQYDNVGLDRVARDLGRNLGRPVQATAAVSNMRFTGSLVVSGPPAEVLERAGPLLGVRFKLQDDKWVMAPANVSAP